ncbi:macrophage colony-stimulating factor 1 receptor-like [Augochlora pura]
MKREVREELNRWKKRGGGGEKFREMRKRYRELCKEKKKKERERWEGELKGVRSERDVWKIVNKERRRRKRVREGIEMREWERHFRGVLGGVEWGVRGEVKERGEEEEEEISREEIEGVIRKLKEEKAEGGDGIVNEVWKYGGIEIREWLRVAVRKGKIVVTFIDMKAAFDSVDREILIQMMRRKGVRESLVVRCEVVGLCKRLLSILNSKYVSAKPVRFVEQANLHILVAIVGEDIVIPCRPTSPSAEVKLKKHDGNGNHVLVLEYTFDPKIGFTLHKIDEGQRGLYICTIAPSEAVFYNLLVSDHHEVPSPLIVDHDDLVRVTKGESLQLKCTIWISLRVDYNIFWIPSQQSKRVALWFDRRLDVNGFDKKIASMMVRDVNFNDEGVYECRVKKGVYENYTRTYVQVHELAAIRPYVSPNTDQINLVEGDPLQLACSGKSPIFFTYPVFGENNTGTTYFHTSPVETNETRDENGTYWYEFRRPNTIFGDTGWYGCSYYSLRGANHVYDFHHPKISWIYVLVDTAQRPSITATNLNKDEIIIDVITRGSERVNLYCYAHGVPNPSITWFKDGKKLMLSNQMYKFSNDSQELELKYPLAADSVGVYMCRAENRIGKVEASQRVTIKGFGTNKSVGLIILLVMLAVVVVILMIYLGLKIRRERAMRKELMEAGLMHFEKGAVESLNPDLTVDDQADLLPYDKKWEFPSDRLKLGKQLGSGAFGVVLKAEALGICEGEAVTTVAVKMVRRCPNLLYISALASELKIMIHLGKHLNVVNLLGACTKNILKQFLLPQFNIVTIFLGRS